MKSVAEMNFGEYIKALRTADDRSLRQTAIAIGVTPQYFSDVEKHNRSGLTPERLESLKSYLHLTWSTPDFVHKSKVSQKALGDL